MLPTTIQSAQRDYEQPPAHRNGRALGPALAVIAQVLQNEPPILIKYIPDTTQANPGSLDFFGAATQVLQKQQDILIKNIPEDQANPEDLEKKGADTQNIPPDTTDQDTDPQPKPPTPPDTTQTSNQVLQPPVSSSTQPEKEISVPPTVNQTAPVMVIQYPVVQEPPKSETTWSWTEKLGFFACIVAFFGFGQSSIMESKNHANDLFGQCQADYAANENSWWKSNLLPCTYRDQPYIYGSAITTRQLFDNLFGISHATIAIPTLLFGLGKLPFPFGT